MLRSTTQSIRLAQPASASLAEESLPVLGPREQPRPKRFVLVSSRLFREGLQGILTGPDIVISDGCQSVAEAVAGMTADHAADLVIVVACSAEAMAASLLHIRAARTRLPTTKWLLLTDCLSPAQLREAVECGVQGILMHDISGDVLKCSAELLLLGQTILPPGLIDLIASRPPPCDATLDVAADDQSVAVVASAPRQAANGAPIHLSERERQILQFLVKGFSNKQIARELTIADATVKVHVKGLLRKMRVTNRTQVAVLAMNYATPPQPGVTVVELPSAALRAGIADPARETPRTARLP